MLALELSSRAIIGVALGLYPTKVLKRNTFTCNTFLVNYGSVQNVHMTLASSRLSTMLDADRPVSALQL